VKSFEDLSGEEEGKQKDLKKLRLAAVSKES
jgi:hypothetical protein